MAFKRGQQRAEDSMLEGRGQGRARGQQKSPQGLASKLRGSFF